MVKFYYIYGESDYYSEGRFYYIRGWYYTYGLNESMELGRK